jgi:3'-5' exonuclease
LGILINIFMIESIPLDRILVLDIETVPAYASYENCPEPFQSLWNDKSKWIYKEQPEATPAEIYARAGIYAEFGKIVCISVGFFRYEDRPVFRVKSFCSHDEKELLFHFSDLLNKSYNNNNSFLCAHNGKEFDFPYIARRLVINGMPLPRLLNIAGKKSWETDCLLDTMHLWRFGDYKNYTSLNLLAAVFGIQSPKDDISGSDVGRIYWETGDIARIAHYCQKDVVTVAQLLLKFRGMPLLGNDDVFVVEES